MVSPDRALVGQVNTPPIVNEARELIKAMRKPVLFYGDAMEDRRIAVIYLGKLIDQIMTTEEECARLREYIRQKHQENIRAARNKREAKERARRKLLADSTSAQPRESCE